MHPPQEFVALDHALHDMRLFKSRGEVNLMRRAGQIAADAHVRGMRFCRRDAWNTRSWRNCCTSSIAMARTFPTTPIVGGGANSCVLHYRDNSARLNDGDLLLVDAGCEYGYYASDITRTYPVNGRFTPEQRAVYEVCSKHKPPPSPRSSRAITGMSRTMRRSRRSRRAWCGSACCAPGAGPD